MLRAGNHGQSIADIQFSQQVCAKLEAGDFEVGGCGAIANIKRLHSISFIKAETFHGTMRHMQQRRQVRVVAIAQQQAIAWNQPDKVFEGRLNRFQVSENVRVIELQVVNDGNLGQVMNEFAALVEKSGVVLVSFDDKPFAIRE